MGLRQLFCDLWAATDAPRCAGCGHAIRGPRLEALDRLWHPEHFRCSACADSLPNRFKVSAHGEPFCASHAEAEVLCSCCEHVIPRPRRPVAGTLCGPCHAEAVREDAVAAALLVHIQGYLRQAGLPWWPQTFPLRLVEQSALRRTFPTPGLEGRIATVQRQTDGRTERYVPEIIALRGLPATQLGSVLAHELGHAWVFHQGIPNLPTQTEEGFCELCAHLWLDYLATPTARHLQSRLAANPNPIYGDGFRQVFAIHQSRGLAGTLDWLRRQGNPLSQPPTGSA